jgi:Spy/CpxP family protein refolding chaperone
MSPIFGSGNRLRLIGAGLLVATFLAGTVAGMAARQTLFADEPPQGQQLERPRPPDARRGDGPRRDPYEGLGLTAEQRSQLDDVFARRRIQIQAFWKEHGSLMEAIRDSARAEVDRIFTPEQRAILDERRELRRAKEREREQQQGRDGPHDGQRSGSAKGWHDEELF